MPADKPPRDPSASLRVGPSTSKADWERDAEREIQTHLDLEAEEQRADGLSDADARTAALRAFGNRALVREDLRALRRLPWIDDLRRDVQYAVRSLRRTPGFTVLVAASTALGIAAASVIVAMLNAALFASLPVARPDRLVAVTEIDRKSGVAGNELSYPDFLDVRRVNAFEGVAALSPFLPASIDGHRDPQRHWGALATANYFHVVKPNFVIGQGFDAARDDTPGAPAVMVLGHQLWRSRFGSAPDIIGRTVAVNGRPATVVGVTAPGFRGTEAGVVPEFWIPFSMLDDLEARMGPISQNRNRHWLDVVGRLRTGVEMAGAAAELDVLAATLNQTHASGRQDRGFFVERAGRLTPEFRGMAATAFAIALGLTVLLLLTGCANAASLVLGRGSQRGREIAARMALGASRGRVIRQLLAESLVLSLLGGALGWVAAWYACTLIGFARAPLGWPLEFTVPLDVRVFAFAFALSLVTGVGVGLVPALRSTRADLVGGLKTGGPSAADRAPFRLRSALVVAQVAVCALLLVCSGLALRSLWAARAVSIGVNGRDVRLVGFDPGMNRRSDAVARQMLRGVVDRAAAVPGVESATLTTAVPLTFIIDNSSFVSEERSTDRAAPRTRSDIYMVGPRFFATLGIPIMQGAGAEVDGLAAPGLAIVNDAFAKAVFPDGPPMGRRFRGDGRALAVAGVVATVKSRTIGEAPRPAIYLPILTEYLGANAQRGVTLVVKTTHDVPVDSLRQAIRAEDPSLAVFDVRTMETHVRDALIGPRLMWGVAATAAGVGLALALVGVYAVVSFSVVRRRRELGIRLAVGARPRALVAMVVGQGLTLAIAGTVLGVVAASALTRFASSLLYGITPTDPIAFVTASAILIVVAVAACIVPAHAAATLDPVDVLRSE